MAAHSTLRPRHRSSPKPTGSRFFAPLLGAVFVLLVPVALHAQQAVDGPLLLTEDEAVRRALGRPAVEEVWTAAVAAEEAVAKTEEAWPNPELGYTREQTFEGAAILSEDFVVLEQTLPLSGRRALLGQAARARAEAARLDSQTERHAMAAQVRELFYHALFLQRRVDVRAEWLEKMRQLEGSIVQRVEAGESAPYELERMRMELAEIVAALEVDRAELLGSYAMLSGLVGLPTEQGELRLDGELLPPTTKVVETAAAARAWPELMAATKRVEAARLQRDAASRWWVPEPRLTGGYKSVGVGEERHHGFIAGVALALPIFDRLEGVRMAADAAMVRAEGQRALIEQRLSARVEGLGRQTLLLVGAAETLHEEGVERADRVLAIAQSAYEGGEISILELIDAARGTVNMRLRVLDVSVEARMKHIELLQYLSENGDLPLPSRGE